MQGKHLSPVTIVLGLNTSRFKMRDLPNNTKAAARKELKLQQTKQKRYPINPKNQETALEPPKER